MSRHLATRGPALSALSKANDALLVLDIDEVVLEFIGPFSQLLERHGARLHAESFKLTGNVRSLATGAALSGGELEAIMTVLYDDQDQLQPVVAGVGRSLARLAKGCDVIFLTAMTPHYYDKRRALLDREGLTYPMIATERSKGAVVAELAGRWNGPIIFVDDLPPNLASVRKSAPTTHLIHLMANEAFRPHVPALPTGAHAAADWPHAETIIAGILGLESPAVHDWDAACG